MKILCVVCLFLAWPLRAAAAQVTLAASASTATIGERIELRVVVRAEAAVRDMRVDVPAGAYEIVGRSRRPAVRTADGSTFEETIVIAFFQTGDFVVGPFRVETLPGGEGATGEETGQVAIRVRSLLGESDKDIQPLKELFSIHGSPRHLLPYAALALLLLMLAVAALWLWKRASQKRLSEVAPPLAPEIELEMGIRELRHRNLPEKGEFRPFFISLSGLLKHFLGRAYGFNAEECTTGETVAQLETRENDGEIVAGLERLFVQADLVKFARQVPGREAIDVIWPMIASLIATHKQRRELAAAATHVQTGR